MAISLFKQNQWALQLATLKFKKSVVSLLKMNSKDDNFANCFQRISFEDTSDAISNADVKRKCCALNYAASLDSFDNWSTCALLDRDLKEIFDVVHDGKENIYEHGVKNKLGVTTKPEKHSGIREMNIKLFIDDLPCSTGDVVCRKSENVTEENFQDFLSLFGENRGKCPIETKSKFSKSFAPQTCSVKDKRFTAVKDCAEKDAEAKTVGFKTARDELNTNAKKYPTSGNQTTGQKRKLGIRRGVGGKFVSPMLSNNDSGEETSKSQEWVNEAGDDRLKNIEPRMVELIKSEIMDSGPTIGWNDIAGLEFAKAAIQEAVVWPMLRPDIFTGLRRPPKGILLFGPPGTGKTLIGKCVASQSKSTFFSISASSLTSKWVGDGEKMVRALFAVARCHQPSVIFIDEIDSLLSQRSDSEHESSRRIKTEFLVQLDGATTDSEELLLVIGATNRPQELDEAARRRFVKRLYIPLPDEKARLQLIESLMCSERHDLTKDNTAQIAALSDGFSGADMKNLCADASLGPIRSIDVNLIQSIQPTEVRSICMGDFTKALSRVKSSVSPKDLDQYVEWNKTYGSGSF